MLPIRHIIAITFICFPLFAQSQPAPQPSTNIPPATSSTSPTSIASTDQPATQLPLLTQLQTAGETLQKTLARLQEQSNQLQANLSALNQQIERIQLATPQTQLPGTTEQYQSLHTEYLQAEAALSALSQQESLLQANMAKLNQQLAQSSQTIMTDTTAAPALSTNVNTATPTPLSTAPASSAPATTNTTPALPVTNTQQPSPTSAPATATQNSHAINATTSNPSSSKAPTPAQSATSKLTRLIEDPASMLRMGGGFIALAIFLLLLLLWPTSSRKDAKSIRRPTNHPYLSSENALSSEENADLEPEYDFMNTDDAIPTRLDLARGYIEMGRYLEAREALKPVIDRGNNYQKQEAQMLIERIDSADVHV